jgi:hypothetical protein
MFKRLAHPLSHLVLALVLSLAGCSAGDETFVFTADSGRPVQQPGPRTSEFRQHIHGLAIAASEGQLSLVNNQVRGQQQVDQVIPGPKGGTATISGVLNIGAEAGSPASSSLLVTLDNFEFYDGLIADGGALSLNCVLWGTRQAAQGTMLLEGKDVVFSGQGSGTHSFKVAMDLVNSKVVKTVVTLDGVAEELGIVLDISNNSTSAPEDVFLTVIGKNASLTAWYYLANPNDTSLTEFEDSPGQFLRKTSKGAFEGSGRYSFSLADLHPVGPRTWRVFIPKENLVSGRIFMSFDRKLEGIGINCPYYSPSGKPVDNTVSATASLTSGNAQVTVGGVDASKDLAVNLPFSYTAGGSTSTGVITEVLSPTLITLSQAPATSGSATITFTPDAALLANAKLGLASPSPTGPPDYLTTFDLMELSATTNPSAPDPYYTLFANTTAIDFYSVGPGMTVSFSGLPPSGSSPGIAPTQKTVGFGASASDILNGVSQRSAIIDRFNNTGAPVPLTPAAFQNFVTAQPQAAPQSGIDPHMTIGKPVDTSLGVIRVLGPPQVSALLPQGDLATYLDNTIASQWGPFCSAAAGLVITYPSSTDPSFTYTGTSASSATLNIKCTQAAGSNTGLNEQYNLPQPSTAIVWECDDPTASPASDPNNYANRGTDAHKRLASIISAALTRGVFPNSADWSDNSKFYTRSDLQYNFFSKIMHDFALDKVVYGFAYDDVYGQDSTLAGPLGLDATGGVPQSDNGNVVKVTLTIPNFTAAPPAPLPGAPLAVRVEQACGDPSSLEGCVVHFTTEDGTQDVNAILDASGQATLTGLKANLTYVAWVAPGGANASNWFFSYAAKGKYDGTPGGTWSSSTGANTPGVVRLQIGRLVPGVGSCLNPQPNSPSGSLPPAPVAGSSQSDWGNLAP